MFIRNILLKAQVTMPVPEIKNYAAENVKELRRRTEMSRREVVDALESRGVKLQQTSLRRIEEGTQAVKIDEAIAFADIFNLDLAQFITEPVNPEQAVLQQISKMMLKEFEELEEKTRMGEAMWGMLGRHVRRSEIPPEQSAVVAEAKALFERYYDVVKALMPLRRKLADVGFDISDHLLEGDPKIRAFTPPAEPDDAER